MDRRGDFDIQNGGLKAYRGAGGQVEIPEQVERIEEYAFAECAGLTGVRFPRSLVSIGDYAFFRCRNLTELDIPGNVETIGAAAFFGCRRLSVLRLGQGVRRLQRMAFFGCSSLAQVFWPQTLESLDPLVFSGCRPDAVMEIAPENPWYFSRGPLVFSRREEGEALVFAPRNLTGAVLPEGVKKIEDAVFAGCRQLAWAELPASLEVVGDKAFEGCWNLTRAELPAGLRKIGARAFAGCQNLISVQLPADLREIGAWAFAGCRRLTCLRVPEGTEEIGDRAFEDCSGLRELTLPKRIVLGDQVFAGCDLRVAAPQVFLGQVDPGEKIRFVQGFAAACRQGAAIDEQIRAEYLRYLRSQRKRFYRAAVQDEALLWLMLEQAVVPKSDLPTLLDLAERQKNQAAQAAVAEYARRKFRIVLE